MPYPYEFTITRGDRQRLPSADGTDYIVLRDPTTDDPLDLGGRSASLSLTTQSVGGERIALQNATEYGDRTAGEVAITLTEEETALPAGMRPPAALYGEWRVTGGPDDPTTTGKMKVNITRSRFLVDKTASLVSAISTLSDLSPFDFGGERLQNVGDPVDPADGVNQRTLTTSIDDHDHSGDRLGASTPLESVGTNLLNSADIATAPAGTVPQSQGDGTLTMAEVGGGWGSPGDFISLFSHTFGTRTMSTSSTTYQVDASAYHQRVTWDIVIPAGEQGAYYFEGRTGSSGAGGDVDIRLQNPVDGETITSVRVPQHSNVTLGPVNYTPTTTASQIVIRVEIASVSGDSVSLADPQGAIGVVL